MPENNEHVTDDMEQREETPLGTNNEHVSDDLEQIAQNESVPDTAPTLEPAQPALPEEPAIPDKEYLIHEKEQQEEKLDKVSVEPALPENPEIVDTKEDVAPATPAIFDKEELIPEKEQKEEKLTEPAISDKENLKVEKEKSTKAPEQIDGIPQKVLDLTPEELDAARRLWAKEHISAAQKKANDSRHARMLERMNEIEAYIKNHPNATVREVALEMNLSEKLTSGYLQKLVKAGRVRARGNTNNRRYNS